ncbi:uncharacterized protein TNIN_154631 [Trichonephila inaurata madagascariensis]|uniref:Reverse transcriptase domain-containing protein n=1 Tax=Trichonephila inaurata madagascariensis TaxID=2747483 RepID=A0A8X6YHB0_9ARAC|nr:uncharacterized protein TNIN_154631 [Trichonephila inaurata madagascariensis]
MSDFPTHSEVSINLFTDDAAILVTKKTESKKALQDYLLILEQWLEKWRIAINTNKSQTILFKYRNPCLPNDPLQLFDRPITWTTKVKYLRVTLDYNLRYHSHLRELKANYWKKYFSLIRLLGGKIKAFPPKQNPHLQSSSPPLSLPSLRLPNLGSRGESETTRNTAYAEYDNQRHCRHSKIHSSFRHL